ncbi:hypothetical protein CUMW_044130, partial [Citrus unshiu]
MNCNYLGFSCGDGGLFLELFGVDLLYVHLRTAMANPPNPAEEGVVGVYVLPEPSCGREDGRTQGFLAKSSTIQACTYFRTGLTTFLDPKEYHFKPSAFNVTIARMLRKSGTSFGCIMDIKSSPAAHPLRTQRMN